ITEAVYQTSDYDHVIEAAVDAFSHFTHRPSLALYALDEATGRLELLSARGFSMQAVASAIWLPVHDSLSGTAIARRELVTSDDVSADPNVARAVQRDLAQGGYHAAVCVPLLLGSRPIGVINLMYKGELRLDDHERDMLLAIGRAIAMALDGARHVAHVEAEVAERRRTEVKLTLLLGFSREADESLSNPDSLFRIIAERGAQLVRDACAVYVVSADRESLDVRASCDLSPERLGPPQPDVGARVPIDAAPVAQVVRSGESAFLPSIDPAAYPGRRSPPVHAALCVPLVARDQVVAVMELVRSARDRPYTMEDRAFAEALAQSASLVIDNATLLEASREVARAREVFLAIAAHELKSPLTPLRLDADWLARAVRSGRASPAQLSSRVAAISRQVSRLERLSDDLVQHAGRPLELAREPVDLGALVSDVCARLRARLQVPESLLDVQIHGTAVGAWDACRLRQAIDKLVDNAVKYGAGKPVRVTLDVEGGLAVLRVSDLGIGIDPRDVARVFEPFERAAPARHYAGLGLGLWIARAVTEAHGGTIDVESRVDQGSTFTMRLPMK
ncbi:MAG TPA: GAF domain-containing protein, partial [Polyangiaceae bacterium]|nr:GAF domain-containing protein [Polyangiaceae bacterium]